MKSLFLFLIVFFLLSSNILSSQPIKNNGFENWTTDTLFQEPEGFQTSNFWSYANTGEANVVKTGDSFMGGYAARLATLGSPDDTIQGMMVLGEIEQDGIGGGIPFVERPTTVKAYLKHDIMPDDTALFFVAFMKQGEAIGEMVGQITGKMDTYYLFEQTVVWFSQDDPDSLHCVISSSNLDNLQYVGSNLYVDSIHFSGTEVPFPYGDLENWTDVIIEEPDDWGTINFLMFMTDTISATKSTDAHEGNYAARVQTVGSIEDEEDNLFGYITNGTFGDDGPEGGLEVDLNPFMVTGYYKYIPQESDTALAAVYTYRYDFDGDSIIELEEQTIRLPETDEYTYFEIIMGYNSQPKVDTINISFASSNFEGIGSGEPYLGSVLFLDQLNITYYPVDVAVYESNTNFSVFPNPSTGKVTIEIEGEFDKLMIYDILGSVVKGWSNKETGRKSFSLIWDGCNSDGAELPDGLYFGKLTADKTQKTFKLILRR